MIALCIIILTKTNHSLKSQHRIIILWKLKESQDYHNKITRRDSQITIIHDPNEYADVSTGQTCRSKRSESDTESTTDTAQAMPYARVDDSEDEDPSTNTPTLTTTRITNQTESTTPNTPTTQTDNPPTHT